MKRTLGQIKHEVKTGKYTLACINKSMKMLGESEYQVLAEPRKDSSPRDKADDWWFNMLDREGWHDDEIIYLIYEPKASKELMTELPVYLVEGLVITP